MPWEACPALPARTSPVSQPPPSPKTTPIECGCLKFRSNALAIDGEDRPSAALHPFGSGRLIDTPGRPPAPNMSATIPGACRLTCIPDLGDAS